MTPRAMRFFEQFRGRIELHSSSAEPGSDMIAIASSDTGELARIRVSPEDARILSDMPRQDYPVGYPDNDSFLFSLERESASNVEKYYSELQTLLGGEDRELALNRSGGHVGVMRLNMTPAQQTAEHAYCILAERLDDYDS